MRHIGHVSMLVAAIAVMGGGAAVPAGAQPPAYPVVTNIVAAAAKSAQDPAAAPPGVDVPCHPGAAHPDPVVLISGTGATMQLNWSGLGPTLANAGYCVYSAALGADPHAQRQMCDPVRDTVAGVAALVDRVLAQTGAKQVDLVGHSQGGLIAEYYTKFFGRGKVHSVVALSPPTHGASLSGLADHEQLLPIITAGCPAAYDQAPHASLVRELNTGRVTVPGVDYTIIETTNENVVTPSPTAAFIDGPGVHDIMLQSVCPTDDSSHTELAYSPTTWRLVQAALDPAHPAPSGCAHF